ADLLVVSVRRRGMNPEDMARLHRFVDSGKPVVGIRTASHAFSPAKKTLKTGYLDWPEFDRQVLGGNYHGHHNNKDAASPRTLVRVDPPRTAGDIVVKGIRTDPFAVRSWLYKT